MSSFAQHGDNLKALEERGFDISEYSDNPYESWNYDDLVYLIADLVKQGASPSKAKEGNKCAN